MNLVFSDSICSIMLKHLQDQMLRHIEPPLASHLSLHRLANYNTRWHASSHRMVHLFEATPKEQVT